MNKEETRLRDAMLAAYASLQNGKVDSAKEALIVGLEGGSVNNPLDFDRCTSAWKSKYSKKGDNHGSNGNWPSSVGPSWLDW